MKVEFNTNQYSMVNMQKIVGMNSVEHYPTIGVINKLDESIFFPIDEVQRTKFIGSFVLENFEG